MAHSNPFNKSNIIRKIGIYSSTSLAVALPYMPMTSNAIDFSPGWKSKGEKIKELQQKEGVITGRVGMVEGRLGTVEGEMNAHKKKYQNLGRSVSNLTGRVNNLEGEVNNLGDGLKAESRDRQKSDSKQKLDIWTIRAMYADNYGDSKLKKTMRDSEARLNDYELNGLVNSAGEFEKSGAYLGVNEHGYPSMRWQFQFDDFRDIPIGIIKPFMIWNTRDDGVVELFPAWSNPGKVGGVLSPVNFWDDPTPWEIAPEMTGGALIGDAFLIYGASKMFSGGGGASTDMTSDNVLLDEMNKGNRKNDKNKPPVILPPPPKEEITGGNDGSGLGGN